MRHQRGNPLLIIAFVVLIVGIYTLRIWYDVKHPCVRWIESTCTSTECSIYVPDADGNLFCASWDSRSYPCNVCVERKP